MTDVALTENLETSSATAHEDVVLTAPQAAKIPDWAEANALPFQPAQIATSYEVGMSAGGLSQPTEPQRPIEIGTMQQNSLQPQPDKSHGSRLESQERMPEVQSSQDAESEGRVSPLRQMMNQRRLEKLLRKLAREAKRTEKEAKRAEKDKTKHAEKSKRLKKRMKQLGAMAGAAMSNMIAPSDRDEDILEITDMDETSESAEGQ